MKNTILTTIGVALLFTGMASTSDTLAGTIIIGVMTIGGALILLYTSRKGGRNEKSNRRNSNINRPYFLH